MEIDLVTPLPDVVRGPLESGILGRALEDGIAEVRVHDLRDYGEGEQRQIDDYPFGGGGGMVLTPGPLVRCLEALEEAHGEGAGHSAPDEVIFLTPDGERFTQQAANRLSRSKRLVLVAGRYKGIDERVRRLKITREISIGDYVLSGGELPALVLIDAVVRLQPGALGDARSALTDSFQDDLLDAPVYTRPASFRGVDVPEVLRSGDHGRIARWRFEESLRRTRTRRPDLLEEDLLEEDLPAESGEERAPGDEKTA